MSEVVKHWPGVSVNSTFVYARFLDYGLRFSAKDASGRYVSDAIKVPDSYEKSNIYVEVRALFDKRPELCVTATLDTDTVPPQVTGDSCAFANSGYLPFWVGKDKLGHDVVSMIVSTTKTYRKGSSGSYIPDDRRAYVLYADGEELDIPYVGPYALWYSDSNERYMDVVTILTETIYYYRVVWDGKGSGGYSKTLLWSVTPEKYRKAYLDLVKDEPWIWGVTFDWGMVLGGGSVRPENTEFSFATNVRAVDLIGTARTEPVYVNIQDGELVIERPEAARTTGFASYNSSGRKTENHEYNITPGRHPGDTYPYDAGSSTTNISASSIGNTQYQTNISYASAAYPIQIEFTGDGEELQATYSYTETYLFESTEVGSSSYTSNSSGAWSNSWDDPAWLHYESAASSSGSDPAYASLAHKVTHNIRLWGDISVSWSIDRARTSSRSSSGSFSYTYLSHISSDDYPGDPPVTTIDRSYNCECTTEVVDTYTTMPLLLLSMRAKVAVVVLARQTYRENGHNSLNSSTFTTMDDVHGRYDSSSDYEAWVDVYHGDDKYTYGLASHDHPGYTGSYQSAVDWGLFNVTIATGEYTVSGVDGSTSSSSSDYREINDSTNTPAFSFGGKYRDDGTILLTTPIGVYIPNFREASFTMSRGNCFSWRPDESLIFIDFNVKKEDPDGDKITDVRHRSILPKLLQDTIESVTGVKLSDMVEIEHVVAIST